MKTSNYILIAVFTLSILSILTFFITAKQNEHFFDKSEILLSDTIKVIVAESNTNFDIRSSDRNILLWNNSIKGTAIYYISNDTLFLNVAAFSPVIMLNHSVSILGEKDNAIVINDYKANRLTVKKTGGNLAMLRNTIDTLQIQATDNATVYLFNANRIEHLSVDMRNGSTFDHGNNSKIGTMNVTIDNQ
ncbi:MAG: hypothetical protein FWH36_09675 [Lentimicrobiaceae bacterium]|nr:hypothetical protein [Lentimicrobiaceae bacterium]